MCGPNNRWPPKSKAPPVQLPTCRGLDKIITLFFNFQPMQEACRQEAIGFLQSLCLVWIRGFMYMQCRAAPVDGTEVIAGVTKCKVGNPINRSIEQTTQRRLSHCPHSCQKHPHNGMPGKTAFFAFSPASKAHLLYQPLRPLRSQSPVVQLDKNQAKHWNSAHKKTRLRGPRQYTHVTLSAAKTLEEYVKCNYPQSSSNLPSQLMHLPPSIKLGSVVVNMILNVPFSLTPPPHPACQHIMT
jgi:hypothetical protein